MTQPIPTLTQQIATDANSLHVLLLEMINEGIHQHAALLRLRESALRADNALAMACEAAVEAGAALGDAGRAFR